MELRTRESTSGKRGGFNILCADFITQGLCLDLILISVVKLFRWFRIHHRVTSECSLCVIDSRFEYSLAKKKKKKLNTLFTYIGPIGIYLSKDSVETVWGH